MHYMFRLYCKPIALGPMLFFAQAFHGISLIYEKRASYAMLLKQI